MKYEVAVKGAHRRKRVLLGVVDLESPSVSSALCSLGWSFYEKRCFQNYWIDELENLVSEEDISLRKIRA